MCRLKATKTKRNEYRNKNFGMISVQVPTSLCIENNFIMHSRYCFVEQCVYPRESNIYMANLYLRDDQKWISFSLSRSLPLFFSLSPFFFFFAVFAHTMFLSFRPSFPLSIPLSCLFSQDPARLFLSFFLSRLQSALNSVPL